MQTTTQVGLVGLGLVGQALAGRLLAGGRRVVGYDIDDHACGAARDLGIDVAARTEDVAAGSRAILLSLPDSGVVQAVLWGDDGLGAACGEGATILDTTTARPSDTVAHHQRLAEQGVRFVDVPLVGSSQEIAAGEAVALVGAPAGADFTGLIETFAQKVFFLGEPGHGHRAKLVVNLVLGLNRLVLAEGLALAGKTGLDPRQIATILKQSAAYARVMDTKGDKMLDQEFQPAARLAQHAKDVGLILELAAEAGARVPVSAVHAGLLDEAIAAGWGGLDNAAIIKTYG